jgi:SAM-dependent methyltransferase
MMSTPQAFDAWAENYDVALARGIAVSGESKDYFARGRLAFLAGCLEKQGFRAEVVLDFGCGTGSATPCFFEQLGCRLLCGVDVSAAQVERAAREQTRTGARFTTLERFAPAGDVDLAYASGVFHHVVPAERLGVAGLIRAALRPGGFFALWENSPWNPGTRYVMSRIPFDRDAIPLSVLEARRLLRAAGFELVRSDFLFLFPAALSWLRFLERPLSRLPLGAQYQVLARKPRA